MTSVVLVVDLDAENGELDTPTRAATRYGFSVHESQSACCPVAARTHTMVMPCTIAARIPPFGLDAPQST